MLRRAIPFGLCLGLATLLAVGCAGYRLGTGSPLKFSTLHIAPVQMRALIPQAQPILTAALRDAFAKDGRVPLVPASESAGASLHVVVRDYRRDVATVRPGDTGLARKFTITLLAEASLINPTNGAEYFTNRRIEVRREVFTDSGQQQAEYQILPLLAKDLADKLTHAVFDTW